MVFLFCAKHSLGPFWESILEAFGIPSRPKCEQKLSNGSLRKHIEKTKQILAARKLPQRIMIDCSHGNSGKNYARQKNVIHSICQQKEAGDNAIFGVMLESHLVEGSQPLSQQQLRYGQSITDSCIGWEETETLLATLDATIRQTIRLS